MENRTGTTQVRSLTAADIDRAAELVADAFADEPQTAALVPDPEHRRAVLLITARRLVRAHLPYATAFGADIDGRLAGVALWNPPHVRPSALSGRRQWASDVAEARSTLLATLPATVASLRTNGRAFARTLWVRQRHLRIAGAGPAWYLEVLATAQWARGRGVARSLVDHVLARCDADGIAAWLETTEEVNVGIYGRFGFDTVVRIPGHKPLPDLWMMRREPVASPGM
jgi:ribosomal protein S18 acetylase RimI-like enzyme